MGWGGAGPGLGREGMPRELGDLMNAATGQPRNNTEIEYTRVAANRWLKYDYRDSQERPIGLRISEASEDPLQKPLAKMWGGGLLFPRTGAENNGWISSGQGPPILAKSHPFPPGASPTAGPSS